MRLGVNGMANEEHGELMHGHEGHDLGDGPWGVLGLLAFLVVVVFLLARNDQVRARALAALALLQQHPAVVAVLRRVAPGSAAGPGQASPVAPEPPVLRPDLSKVDQLPAALRGLLTRVDDLASGVQIPRADGHWPDGVLAEHRLDTLRANLVDLVDTLAQIPADIAVEPASSGISAVDEAAVTATLLEQEALRLRAAVNEGLVARLRRQRLFVAEKYQQQQAGSSLDL